MTCPAERKSFVYTKFSFFDVSTSRKSSFTLTLKIFSNYFVKSLTKLDKDVTNLHI